ncbi:MAG: hypothetical protein ACT4OM_09635 [Actinomycetota bacterium]
MRHTCRTPNRKTAPVVLGVVIALTGVSCGPSEVASPTEASSIAGEGTVEYPLTVQNCDD